MAVDMQCRLEQLNRCGVIEELSSRSELAWASTRATAMWNFGSDDRMDYTIIGAEAT